MKPETSDTAEQQGLSEPPHLGGTVELIPRQPMMTQFISPHCSWLFPMLDLGMTSLRANPQFKEKSNLPPDELMLRYSRATVVIRGWRLEWLMDALGEARVACVHAEEKPATLPTGEPWVSEIHVTEDPDAPETPDPV